MPATAPWTPTYDFGADPAPQSLINAQALQGQLFALAAYLAAQDVDLSVLIRDDNTLNDQVVQMRNLAPDLLTYLQSAVEGTVATNALSYRLPVKGASIAPISYASFTGVPSGPVQTALDGLILADGDDVLIKDQAAPSQNGIWTIHAGAWTRRSDLSAGSTTAEGWAVSVLEGASNGGTAWRLIPSTASATALVGTDALTFGSLFAGPWPLAISKGGTGAITAAGARAALSTPGKYAQAITADGISSSFTINHNLGTLDVVVSVTGYSSAQVGVTVNVSGVNSLSVSTAVPLPAGTYRVTVIG